MDTANDRDHQSQALATLRDHQVDALLVIAPDLIAYRPVEAMSTIPTILVNCIDPDASVAIRGFSASYHDRTPGSGHGQ